MATNRLNLDFSLNTNIERSEFLEKYLQREEFIKRPPTEDEMETMANYVLWGKDPITGKNVVQTKEIQIETRNGTWDRGNDVESLDAMMESPTFNEAQLQPQTEAMPKKVRETFSRSEALAQCPPSMVPVFKDLFRRIDELDLCINFYDLAHGKREKEPRPELLAKFTAEEQEVLKERVSHWNQFKYLKRRHLLVEMRREQFTLKDTYASPIQRHSAPPIHLPQTQEFEADISVLPLGIMANNKISPLIFKDADHLNPSTYSEKELEMVSRFYWEKKETKPSPFTFDFRNVEHVYELFLQFFDIEDDIDPDQVERNTNAFLKTLMYYVDFAELPEAQREILDFKMKKVKNQDIADYINKKYGKSYTANYISTIFRQKIIPEINATAARHEEILTNLYYPENFKECSCCGRSLLRSADNFVRKSRAKDGFANRCKNCDRLDRQAKKGGAK